MKHELVLVLDFGGQYNQLIARRVRECGVYCEVKPYTTPLAELKALDPIGIIFTGGPNSVYLDTSPHVDPDIFTWGVPILGICYGCQLMAHSLGGLVTPAQEDTAREYGKTETFYETTCKLFKGLPAQGISWMSHSDYMAQVPDGFQLMAHSDACPNVAIADEQRGFYGVQFHPEVNHTEHGVDMIRNFLYEVCRAAGDWTMGDYCKQAIQAVREEVGDGKVLLGLSGGVDSSVAAALLAEAVGSQLTCVFVDHGLMRKNEGDEVEAAFAKFHANAGTGKPTMILMHTTKGKGVSYMEDQAGWHGKAPNDDEYAQGIQELDALENVADSIHAVSDAMTQLLGTTTLTADQKLDEGRLQFKLAAAEARDAAGKRPSARETLAAIRAKAASEAARRASEDARLNAAEAANAARLAAKGTAERAAELLQLEQLAAELQQRSEEMQAQLLRTPRIVGPRRMLRAYPKLRHGKKLRSLPILREMLHRAGQDDTAQNDNKETK